MKPLAEVAAFEELDGPTLEALVAIAGERLVRTGGPVLRRGTRGREVLVVASGGVRVDLGSQRDPVHLGPGAVVGEISVLAEAPITANVVADRDTHLWVLPREPLLALMDRAPGLRSALMQLVLERRTRDLAASSTPPPQVALVALPEDAGLASAWSEQLRAAVDVHVPVALDLEGRGAIERIPDWRATASPGEVLLVGLAPDSLAGAADVLERGDAVLRADASAPDATVSIARWGLADHARVRDVAGARAGAGERWAFGLDRGELERAPSRASTPHLDRLARWIARRQVGVALGAGAARGFAHLGVLAELEEVGVPVDRIAGTSMGGIAGLLYGLADDGDGGIANGASTLGRPGARRLRWWPRDSFLSDAELRRRARVVAEGRNVGDLRVPVSVVATDLAAGERVVVDRGPVDEAFFATSAVPGALPPVIDGDRVLVDGALVSRIPTDLLPPTRCALRIAVNVIPSPDERAEPAALARDLRARMGRWLGLREVLGRSWELLGWWHGARDVAGADVLLEPRTAGWGGYDFASAWAGMVEAGRASVREQAEELRALVADRVDASDG